MKLVVNSEGVYLTKVGECFCLKKEGQKQEIAAKKVEQIIITTSTALSTDAIELAVENNIDIVFLKKYGKPFGRVWHSKVGSISTIRKRQLNLDSNKMGTILVKEFLTQKMTNQVEFLNELSMNRRDNRKIEIKEDIEKIKGLIEKIKSISEDEKINVHWLNLSIRHEMRRIAFSCLISFIIPDTADISFGCLCTFPGRVARTA